MLGPFIGQTFGNIINTVSMPPVVWLDDTWGPCSRGDNGWALVGIWSQTQLRQDVNNCVMQFIYFGLGMGFVVFCQCLAP